MAVKRTPDGIQGKAGAANAPAAEFFKRRLTPALAHLPMTERKITRRAKGFDEVTAMDLRAVAGCVPASSGGHPCRPWRAGILPPGIRVRQEDRVRITRVAYPVLIIIVRTV